MRTTSRYLALLVALLSFGSPATAQAPKKADAKSILNNMFKVYSGLASYQDEGVTVTTTDEPTGGTIEKMPFKTFFKRPDLFRFEWIDFGFMKSAKKRVVWSNGKETFTYWQSDFYEKEESLSLAVAGATGVSSGTVLTVLRLLSQDKIGSSSLKELVNVSLVGEDVLERVDCYRIKATEMDDPVELWVGKTDFLLRKLRRETKSGDGLRITEEIRRKIQVDQSIAEDVFNYNPPMPLTPRKDVTAEVEKILNPGPPAWSEFKSDEGRFSVLMPAKPTSQASTVETPQGRYETHGFTALHGALVCVVTYTDMPKPSMIANDIDSLFEGFRDQFIKQLDGKLASESSVSLDGHPGREIKAHVYRGELRVRVFLVSGRVYQLGIISMDKVLDAETLNKFFASFKLTPISRPIAALRTPD